MQLTEGKNNTAVYTDKTINSATYVCVCVGGGPLGTYLL